MHKYQNVSGDEQVITAEGHIQPRKVAPGAEVVSSVAIENPNFKYVGATDEQPSGAVQAVQERSPASISGVTEPQPEQENN